MGIVVNGQVRIGEDVPGRPRSEDGAHELRSLGSRVDGPSGRGPRDALARLQSVVEIGNGVDRGASGLDIEEVVDAVPAAR